SFKKGTPKWQGGIYDAFKDPRKRAEIQRIAKVMSQDEYTLSRELLKAATKLNMTNQEFAEALHSGDMFRIKNAEARSLFTIAAAYNNAGMLDVFTSNQVDKIKGLTDEEFRNEFGYENMSDEDIKIRKEEVIKSFENQAKNIKDAMDKASYYVDSKNQRDLHEAISFSIFTSKNLDEREAEIAKILRERVEFIPSDEMLDTYIKLGNILKSNKEDIKLYEELQSKIINNEERINSKYKNLRRALTTSEMKALEEAEKEIEKLKGELHKVTLKLKNIAKNGKVLDEYDNNIDSFADKLNGFLKTQKEINEKAKLPETHDIKDLWNDLQNIATYREQLITEYHWLFSKEGETK